MGVARVVVKLVHLHGAGCVREVVIECMTIDLEVKQSR